VSTQELIESLVGSFRDEVNVHLTEGREEAVRIGVFPDIAVGETKPNPIRERK
jgi:hypothetical protein